MGLLTFLAVARIARDTRRQRSILEATLPSGDPEYRAGEAIGMIVGAMLLIAVWPLLVLFHGWEKPGPQAGTIAVLVGCLAMWVFGLGVAALTVYLIVGAGVALWWRRSR